MEAGGMPPAGSARALRLDPFTLPVRYPAKDSGADGQVRQVELYRERVVLRRAVRGMRMSVGLPVSAFSSAWPTPFAPCKGLSFQARQRSRRPPPARPLSNQPTRMRPLLRYLCLSGWELHC